MKKLQELINRILLILPLFQNRKCFKYLLVLFPHMPETWSSIPVLLNKTNRLITSHHSRNRALPLMLILNKEHRQHDSPKQSTDKIKPQKANFHHIVTFHHYLLRKLSPSLLLKQAANEQKFQCAANITTKSVP